MKVTVAIPTYKRPEYVRRAIASINSQSYKPYELIVISRRNDQETRLVILECIQEYDSIVIRNEFVDDEGFLPPVIKAIDCAKADILAFLDDDAEAHSDWLSRIVDYYSDSNVGGVGGRYINYLNGVKQEVSPCSVVAKLFWYGKSVGNMYRDTLFSSSQSADFLIGGNMSYRLPLLRDAKPDYRLNKNVSFHWEMDVGLQIKKIGYSIIFDPKIIVDHHSAPREVDGLRTVNYDGVFWSNYNYALLMRKHLSHVGFLAYIIYSVIIGWGGSPGILHIIARILRGKKIEWHHEVFASFVGRLKGVFLS